MDQTKLKELIEGCGVTVQRLPKDDPLLDLQFTLESDDDGFSLIIHRAFLLVEGKRVPVDLQKLVELMEKARNG